MGGESAGSPGAHQKTMVFVRLILENLRPSEHVFSIDEGGATFSIYYTRWPGPPHDPITVAVIISEKESDPLVVASILDGWVKAEKVKEDIIKARASLS